jgi:hypothetical protein
MLNKRIKDKKKHFAYFVSRNFAGHMAVNETCVMPTVQNFQKQYFQAEYRKTGPFAKMSSCTEFQNITLGQVS